MPSPVSTLHNLVFRRTSTMAFAVIVSAFFFERAFDISTEYTFDQLNKGKMWKDIKHRYTE